MLSQERSCRWGQFTPVQFPSLPLCCRSGTDHQRSKQNGSEHVETNPEYQTVHDVHYYKVQSSATILSTVLKVGSSTFEVYQDDQKNPTMDVELP